MFEIIKLELKIFFKKKKNIIAVLAFNLLLILVTNISSSLEHQKINGELGNTQLALESIEQSIAPLNEQYKETKDLNILKISKSCEEEKKIYENKKQAIKTGNTFDALKADIQIDEITLKGIENKTLISGESKDVVKDRLGKNKYLLNNNISPIYDVTMSSYNFLIVMGKEVLPLFLIILIFLFSGDMISRDSDMGTYKLLLIQPISRVKVLYSKIIAAIAASLIMVLGTLSVFFIGLGFIKGLGSPNYPMSFYDISGNKIINIGIAKFCIYFLAILIFIIIFYVSLASLISTITNNSTTSIGVSITLGISIFILNTQLKLAPKMAHLNPFTYMNIPNTLNGSFSIQFDNTNINYKSCLICIIIFTALNIIITTLIFKKRDVIC